MTKPKYNIDDVLGAVEQRYYRGWSGRIYIVYCMVVAWIPMYLVWATLEETPVLLFVLIPLLMPICGWPIYSFVRKTGIGRFQASLISAFSPKLYRAGQWVKVMFTPKPSRSNLKR